MPDKKQPEETSRRGGVFCASGFRGCSQESMEAEGPEAVAAACSHLGGSQGTQGAAGAHMSFLTCLIVPGVPT